MRSSGENGPAVDLAEVWDLLEELPRGDASAASRLTATTLSMAAIEAGSTPARLDTGLRRWLPHAAAVTAALLLGILVGRQTAPSDDLWLLERLPVVRHFDLLREAGSVRFLEELTARDPPPLRLLARQGPEALERTASSFRNDLDSLASWLAEGTTAPAARRDRVAGLSLEERAELERAARQVARLSAAEQAALEALARSLVDPGRSELRDAALAWHQWLSAVRPEDRERVIASGSDKRLEWIDWYATLGSRLPPRFDPRGRPGGPRPGPAAVPGPPGGFRPGGGPPRGETRAPPR
jgi:hypothetical protein